ncbi:MAG: STAS domain-containing protein [Ruminococcus sp.]|nr:STAS domain-containing protein [Candidatus Copronaster equi]
MLNIIKNPEGTKLTMSLEGRLDTTTAPQLENEISTSLEGVTELVFDFAKLEYISSAGLRIMLSAQKVMNKQGEMVIKNVCDDIVEVFEITGFADIMNIE